MSFKHALIAGSLALCAAGAQAGTITTYSAQDDGAPTTGPWPNSSAEETTFLSAASAFGPTRTETFEELTPGTGGGGGTFAITGGSVVLDTAYSPPYGGVVSGNTNGNLYGFNVTPGGANWLGIADGSATFDFTKPTNSFGFWTTGVQSVFTSALTVTFSDGASQTLDLPINVNGGASYFGFTDTTAISSVTITNISDDAWGIDDVSFNFSAVPEPAEWALMLAGFAGLGLALRTRRRTSLRAAV
jgi:hypothetical protein